MTSVKSSANKKAAKYDLKQSFKSVIAPAIISLLVLADFFIINVINGLKNVLDFEENSLNFVQKVRENYHCMLLSEYIVGSISFACIFCGIIFAVFSFMFIMKKRKVNFYYSIPIDRATMFKNRMIAPLILMALVLFVTLAVDVGINLYYFTDSVLIIKTALAIFAESIVYMFSAFIIVSIAFIVCYTGIEALFFGAGLIWLPTIAVLCLDNILQTFLYGYARISTLEELFFGNNSGILCNNSLLSLTTIINPLLFGKSLSGSYLTHNIYSFAYQSIMNSEGEKAKASYPDINYIIPIIVWAVLCIAFVFIARHLFLKRKAENAGIHFSNKTASAIFAFEVSLASSSLLVYALTEDDTIKSNILSILILAVSFILVFYICISISKRSLKVSKNIGVTALSGVAVVVIFSGILAAGGFGYSNYIPDPDDIELAAITSNNIDFTHNEDRSVDENAAFSLDYSNDCLLGVFEDKDDLKSFTEVVKGLVKKTDNMIKSDSTVIYKLKNGRTVSRAYTQYDADAAYNILSLTDTKAYNEELEYILTSDVKSKEKSRLASNMEKLDISETAFSNGMSYYTDDSQLKEYVIKSSVYIDFFNINKEAVEIKNTMELREAVLKDLRASTFESRFRSSEMELCRIHFVPEEFAYEYAGNIANYDYDQLGDSSANTITYRVYPSMKNTVEYLKKNGVAIDNDYFDDFPTKAYFVKYKTGRDKIGWEYRAGYNYMFKGDYITSSVYNEDLYENEQEMIDAYGDKFNINNIYSDSSTKDPDKIKELINAASTYRYASFDDYSVLFEYEQQNGNKTYALMIIPEEKVMDWMKNN